MSDPINALHFAEPELMFGYGRRAVHTKDGLFLYGPLEDRKPAEMRVGVIGTEGIGIVEVVGEPIGLGNVADQIAAAGDVAPKFGGVLGARKQAAESDDGDQRMLALGVFGNDLRHLFADPLGFSPAPS